MKNRRAASMPLALVFFTVCVILGTAIVTVGTTLMGKTSTLVKAEMPNYISASLFKVLNGEMSEAELEFDSNSLTPEFSADGVTILAPYIENAFKEMADSGANAYEDMEFEIECSTDEDQTYEITAVLISYSSDKTIELTITGIEKAGEELGQPLMPTIRWESSEIKYIENKKHYIVSYGKGILRRGKDETEDQT